MAGQDNGGYNPLEYARGGVKPFAPAPQQEDLASFRVQPEKHPTATLHIFGSNLGDQPLAYGAIGGGGNAPVSITDSAVSCSRFFFIYGGIISMGIAETPVIGNWKVTVSGSGLVPIMYWIDRHLLSAIKLGETVFNERKIVIDSITIEPVKVIRQKAWYDKQGKAAGGIADDDDDDEE